MNRAGQANPMRRMADHLVAAGVLTGIGAIIWLNDFSARVAFLAIGICALIPAYTWLKRGAPGLPTMPVVGGLYVIYFAIPIVTGNTGTGTDDDVLRAGLTVSSFLVAACLTWRLTGFRTLRKEKPAKEVLVSDRLILPLIQLSLTIGMLFILLFSVNALGWLGSFFGVIRTVGVSAASIGCFLTGYAQGQGRLTREGKIFCYTAIIIIQSQQLLSLFLIGPLTDAGAIFLGYIISSRRIPWFSLIATLMLAALLHEGKDDMRAKYWRGAEAGPASFLDTPFFLADWTNVSWQRLMAGSRAAIGGQNLIDRASLMSQLILVQRETPDPQPFLNGATYAFLPQMLVPRFLNPGKVDSQIVLNLLSVRYGLQSPEATLSTTLGWGIVPEAYANFGYTGVIVAGLIFGLLTGILGAIAINAPVLSLPNFLSVISLVTMLDLEADFSYLMVNLFTALVSVFLFFAGWKILQDMTRRRPDLLSGSRLRNS